MHRIGPAPRRERIARRVVHGLLITTLASSALSPVVSPAWAQSAPVSTPPLQVANSRTGLDVTPAGTPIVNIAAPDKTGTSYNVYTRLSAGKEGLIFNNNPTVGQSTVGGFLLANPSLAGGQGARLIINEVTGGVRTSLAGPVEVFGRQAALVIANPTGITCDGCGFLNTSRVSLAAANLTFGADGAFTGFRTRGNDVSIEGKGLLAGNVDYFDIIAAVTHINASLYAKDLVVAGGAGTYDYASRSSTGDGQTLPAGAPSVAIDSSALGGMYANRIRLIGTGAGVGINLAGTVGALDGPLVLTSDGAITLAKAVSAGDATITSTGGAVTLTDQTYAGGNLAIAGQVITQNGGFAGALGNAALTATQGVALSGTGIYAGLDSTGALTGTGAVTIRAGGLVDTGTATLAAGGATAINSASLVQASGGQIAGKGVTLATSGAQTLGGTVSSSADVRLSGDAIDLSGTLGANGALALSGRQITLAGAATGLGAATATASDALSITGAGALQSNGLATLSAPRLDLAGKVTGGGGVVLSADSLSTSGAIQSGGDLGVTTTGDAMLGGSLAANGNAALVLGGNASLTGTLASAGRLDLQAGGLTLSGTAQAGGALALASASDLATTGTAQVLANGSASLTATGALTLAGQAGSNDALVLVGNAVDLSGTAQSLGKLTLQAGTFSLSGKALTAGDLAATATGAASITGTLSASGALTLTAPAITTGASANLLAGQALAVTTPGAFTHAGTLSGGAVTVAADTLANSGTLVAAGGMALTGFTRLTQAGTVQAGGTLTLTAPEITLSGQTLGAVEGGAAGVTIHGPSITFAAGSDLESGGTLDLASSGDLTTQGRIVALGAANLSSQGALAQNASLATNAGLALAAGTTLTQSGSLSAAGPVTLAAPVIVNSGSVTGNGTLALSATGAVTSTGALLAGGALTLTAPLLTLSGTAASNDVLTLTAPEVTLSGTASGLKGLAATVDTLTVAASGALQSGAGLDLALASLDNAGLISSERAVALATTGAFANSGRIVAGDALTLAAAHDLSSSGLLQAATGLAVHVGGAGRLAGTLYAGGDAALDAASLQASGAISAQGVLSAITSGDAAFVAGSTTYARGSVLLSAANLSTLGTLQGDGALTVRVAYVLSLGGATQAHGGTTLAAGTSATVSGSLASGGALVLAAPTVALPGQVLANDTVAITANTDNLSLAGTIQAAKEVALAAVEKLTIGTPGASGGTGSGSSGSSGSGGSGSSGSGNGGSGGGGSGSSGSSSSFAFTGPQLATPIPGSLASNDAVTLTAADIEIDGLVVAQGDLSALASHVLTVKGSAWSDGALTANGGSLAIGSGASFAAQGPVRVTAAQDIANLGTIASNAGDVSLSYGGAYSNAGTIAAKGAYTVTTGADYAAAGTVSADTIAITARDIALSGTTIGAHGLTLAGRDVTLGAGSDTESGAGLSLTSTGGASLAGKLMASGDLAITAGTALAMASSATSEAGGKVTFSAAGDLTLASGSTLAAKGALSLTGNRLALAGIAGSNAGITLAATDTLGVSGTVTALGDVAASAAATNLTGTLAAKGSLALTGGATTLGSASLLQAGKALALTASGLDAAGALQGAAGLTVASSGDARIAGTVVAGTVDSTGVVTSLADLSLASAGALAFTGVGSATGKGAFKAGALTLGGSLVALGDLALDAATIAATGTLQANGALTATSTSDTTLGGTLTGLAGLTLISGGALNQGATLGSNGRIGLTAAGALSQTGTTSAGGDIAFTGATLSLGLSLGGGVTANGTLALVSTTGGADIASGATLAAKTVTLTSAGDSTIAGTLAATSDLTASISGRLAITSTGALQAGTADASGAVTSTGTMALGAGTLIANAGSIFSTGALAFHTPSLVNTGTITSGADIDLTAASLSLGGTFASLGNVAVTTTAGTLAITGGLEGRNVTLSATGGDLMLGAASHITAYGTGTAGRASLTGTGAIDALGIIIANTDVSLTAAGAIHIGADRTGANPAYALSSAGNVTLTAGGALVNAGTVEAGKALALTATSLASENLLTGGKLAFTTAGDIALTGTTYGAGGVALASSGGTLTLGSAGTLQSPGAITLGAAGDLTNGGVISAGPAASAGAGNAGAAAALAGTISLTSGGALTSTGGILSNNDGISLSGHSITLGGKLGSGGGVYAATTLALDTPALTLNDGGEVVANQTLGYSGTSLSLGNGSLLQSNRDVTITLGGTSTPGSYVSAGSLIALGDLGLTATGGSLINQAGGGIFAGGTGSAAPGGSITLAAASLDNAGQIVATASASGAAGNVSLNVPVVSTSGLLHADRALALSTASLTIDGTLANSANSLGTVEAGGPIAWTIPAIALVHGGTLRSAGGISLSGATLASAGAIRAGGDLVIATSGDLTSTGTLATPGTLSLASGTTLTLEAASQTLAGAVQATPAISTSTISLAAPTISALGTLAATGGLALRTNDLTVSGSAIANGDVTLAGTGAGPAPALTVSATGQLASYLGNVNLGTLARADIAGALVATQGDIAFTSPATTITATGRIAAGRDLAITTTGGGALAVAGQAQAVRDLTLTGGVLTLAATGLVQAGHDLAFSTGDASTGAGSITINGAGYDYTGTPISARVAGNLRAGHDIALVMPGALVVDGGAQIVATNDLTASAASALIGARASTDASGAPLALGVLAGRDLTLTATTGGLTLDGSLQAGRNLTVRATGGVSSTAPAQFVAGDRLTITGASLALAGFNSAQNRIAFTAGGDATLSGASVSNGRITLSAGGAGTITDTGSVTVHGGAANTAFGRDIGALAEIDLESGGSLINHGAIWSDGVVFLTSATGDVTNAATGTNGGITAGTIITRTDAGSFRNQAGAFKAANAGLFLGGDFINTGSFTPSGNYSISAANIANTGLIATSGNLTLDAAGTITNTGTIYSGNRLTLRAGGTLANDYSGDDQGNGSHGLILAQSDIAITAHDLFNQSATIQSLSGSIEINLTGGNLSNTIKQLVLVSTPAVTGGLFYTAFNWTTYVSYQRNVADDYPGTPPFTTALCNRYIQIAANKSVKYGCSGGSYSFSVKEWGSGWSSESTSYNYTYQAPSLGGTALTFSTGTSTISAARDLTINGGAGAITNQNAAMLAGGNIAITTSGAVNNIADLLADNTTINGTTSSVNSILPGAPTLIQAGGAVSIQAGTFSNIANNLASTDSYTGLQVVQHAAPSTPGASAPGTGSNGITGAGATGRAASTGGTNVIAGGTAASTSGGSGFAAQGAGTLAAASGTGGITLNLATATRSGAGGNGNGGAVAPLTAGAALSGSTSAAGQVTVGGVGTGSGGATANGLVDGTAQGTGLIGGTAATVGGAASVSTPGGDQSLSGGASGASPLTAGLVSAFNGKGLPSLSNQGFGTFLGGFLSSFNLSGNSPALFTYNSNPDSAYLFTTSASLASQAALYDSSYFFDRLAPDRGTTYTRLGDGFFEAMLVSREVQAATGAAQLASFGSVLDQYQALLRNAADQQAGLGLSLGVALTDAQVAQLTSPMLWYVNAQVEGRDVLVPVLYLAASDTKTIAATALVGGTNVLVSANGGITNSGTIKASQVVALAANGGDLVNASGGTIAGGAVVAQAANDILLKGGSTIAAKGAGSYALPGGATIAGGGVALSAGRDIVTSTITSTANTVSNTATGSRNYTYTNTVTDKVAGATISSTAGTQLAAGQNIALNAATLTSQGATMLVAGNAVNIAGAEATTHTWDASAAGRYASSVSATSTTSNTGTSITAGGPVSIAALGGSLGLTGSSIKTTSAANGAIDLYGAQSVSIASAQDTASLSKFEQTGKKSTVTTSAEALTNDLASVNAAGALSITTPGALAVNGGTLASDRALTVKAGSVAVNGVINSQSSDVATWQKKSGFLSSTTTTTHTVTSDQIAIASTLSGDTVQVTTPGAVSVTGSNLVASNGLGIAAGGPVTIGALATTDTEDYSVSVKKSGFSLGGGGLFLGVAKTKTDSHETETTQNGSRVGTANGDLAIVSNQALSVTGSQIAAGGDVLLKGTSIAIANALDTSTSTSTTKSSSFGLSIGVQSPVIAGATAAVKAADIATSSGEGRTQAVAALAGGLAAYNTYNALSKIASVSDLKKAGSLSISLGFSSSKSTSSTTGESVVGSTVTGNDVTLLATGAGAGSTIAVTGSTIKAANDLTLAAQGDITLAAAAAQATQAGTSRSSGASLGVSISAQGIAATASVNGSKGNYAGASTTWTDAVASAGNVATVTTPGALALTGGQLAGNTVRVDAASLAITSLQDTSTYNAKSSGFGVGVSVPLTGAGQVGVTGSFSSSNQNGTFASVGEDKQAGITAGSGGFDIHVAGATDLKGGVIASTADAANNSLTTGTLTASDIANHEQYRASQVALSGGVTFGNSSAIFKGNDGKATPAATGSGSPIPGVTVGGVTLSAATPVAMSASGSQSSTTASAIAPGTITITSGDAASQNLARTIGRDTSGATNALTQQFTDAKRTEIAKGFEAASLLTQQVGTFLADKAAQSAKWAQEHPDDDPKNNPYATWGAGGSGNLVLTALSGAAGSNVAGSLGSLVQSAAVNVLQGLATQRVKEIADSFSTEQDDNGHPLPNATSETVRSALQALTACAGSAAGGSGQCGGAAMGAAASVVLNNLLSTGTTTATDKDGKPLTLSEQQARSNLVSTIVAAIASGVGLNANAATTAAQIETQNNSIAHNDGSKTVSSPCTIDGRACTPQEAQQINDAFYASPRGEAEIAAYGSRALAETCSKNSEAAGCADGQARLAVIEGIAGGDAAQTDKLLFQLQNGQTSYAELAQRLNTANTIADKLLAGGTGTDTGISRDQLVMKLAQLTPTAQQMLLSGDDGSQPNVLVSGLSSIYLAGQSNSEELDTIFSKVQMAADLKDAVHTTYQMGKAAVTSQTAQDIGTLIAAGGGGDGTQPDPYWSTSAGQVAVQAASQRLLSTGAAALNGLGKLGLDVLTLAAPPPGASPDGITPGSPATTEQIAADQASKAAAAKDLYNALVKPTVVALDDRSTAVATTKVVAPLAAGAVAGKIAGLVNGTVAADGAAAAESEAIAAGASLVGRDGNLGAAAAKITPQPGVFDVVVHGDANGFYVQNADGSWAEINANNMAQYISKNGYAGEPIRLVSCSTGSCSAGAAQNLANQLGVSVQAPSDTVWIHPNGQLTIGTSPTTNTGTWNTFVPQGHKP